MQNVFESFNFNEQFKNFADLSNKGLEPVRILAGFSADTFEQVARKNYEVAGEVLELAVQPVSLPMTAEELKEVASAQAEKAKSFAELMQSRSNDYVEMSKEISSKAQEAVEAASASFK